jgi:formylglycine-generating enzyme required for sulfatase activity
MLGIDPDRSIVRILKADGEDRFPSGGGVLISDRHVLTCAHVVEAALGVPEDETLYDAPETLVPLDFPLIKNKPMVWARVDRWYPKDDVGGVGDTYDLALLVIDEGSETPKGAVPALIWGANTERVCEMDARMCGFPENDEQGWWLRGRTTGKIGSGCVQLDPAKGDGCVVKGFSGTPVWDRNKRAVLGLAVAFKRRAGKESSYILPASMLIRAAQGAATLLDWDTTLISQYFGRDGVYRNQAFMALGCIVLLALSLTFIFLYCFPLEVRMETDFGTISLNGLVASAVCIAFMLTLSKIFKDFKMIIVILIPFCLGTAIVTASIVLDQPILEVSDRVIHLRRSPVCVPTDGDAEDGQDDALNGEAGELEQPSQQSSVQPPTAIDQDEADERDQSTVEITEKGDQVPSSDTVPVSQNKPVEGYRNVVHETHSPFEVNGMKFVWIPPDNFMMGSPEDEPGRFSDETLHKVILTEGFYMQTTEVTQAQWTAVMGSNPSYFDECGPDCPVENVSWEDAQSFLKKLNGRGGDYEYRLPTEAQWEYACRAGTTTRYHTGDSEADLARAGWYGGNSGGKTHPVGQKEANAFGLHDMHGNVWEWCADWFGGYPSGPVTDPTGPESGARRVLRGGSWVSTARGCRSAYRGRDTPVGRDQHLGFRALAVRGPR